MDILVNDRQEASISQPGAGDFLCHDGMVSSVDPTRPAFGEVTIHSASACAACHAKGVCTSLDSQAKVMSVRFMDSGVAVGDRVRVMLAEKLGWQALLIAIVMPLLLLMAVILGLNLIWGVDETLAAIIGLASLLPYYFLLSLFRRRLQKRFVLYAKKIET